MKLVSASGASGPAKTATPREAAACTACGAADADDGDGYCKACGYRLAARSTLPGAIPTKVGEFTVVQGHGDGDVLVRDAAGAKRLLVLGANESVSSEAGALLALATSATSHFARIVSRGDVPPSDAFFVVDGDVESYRAVGSAPLAFPAALALIRSLLSAAELLESAGYSWEPEPSDLYVDSSGVFRALRARGARRLLLREPLNAKRVLEALGSSLVPTPLTLGTPGLLRLLLPRSNFSTAATQTIAAAREEVARAEATFAARPTTPMAELCDPGLKRDHNEDATAVSEGDVHGEPFKVLVVCDGVSSSTHAEQASGIASKVARDVLTHFATSGDILHDGASSAVIAAIRAAHIAVCTSPIDYGDGPPPGTTIVAALIFRKSLTVGWVGDSRAYWVSEQGAELCTTDHSWVNEAVARGEVTMAEAMKSPLAHALTKCLGPLETGDGKLQEIAPDARTKALPGPGTLVLCTDGLWNYFPSASAIATLVHGASAGLGTRADPSTIARFLVGNALAQGGGDNVSVAILDVR